MAATARQNGRCRDARLGLRKRSETARRQFDTEQIARFVIRFRSINGANFLIHGRGLGEDFRHGAMTSALHS